MVTLTYTLGAKNHHIKFIQNKSNYFLFEIKIKSNYKYARE